MVKRISIYIIFSVLACPAFSQLLESVELNDYIDPNYRKLFSGDSINFLNIVPALGVARNYQYNNEFNNRYSNTLYAVSKTDMYYYVGNFQMNAKMNYFNTNREEESDVFRAKAQLCYYVAISPERYGDEDYTPPIRLQLTYNLNSMAGMQDHQIFFDYSANIVRPESGYNFITSNVFAGWTLNRQAFLYGVTAKGSFFVKGMAGQIVKAAGYGYSVLRSKVDKVDRWGNFKLQFFSVVGQRYGLFSAMLTFSWTRELHLKFNVYEMGVMLRNPLTSKIKRSNKKNKVHE